MTPAEVERLQADLLREFGEPVTVGSWDGEAIEVVPGDADAPGGSELTYSSSLVRLAFPESTAPPLPVGQTLTWRGKSWVVDGTPDASESLITVALLPAP